MGCHSLPSPVLSGECVISSVLSRRSKNLKQWTSVTAQLQLCFIWQAKENTSLRHEGGSTQKTREASSSILAPLFMCFFSHHPCPPSLPYVNWANQEGCLFYLRSSDLPLFYFHGLFPSLSFSHGHSGLFFPMLTT